MPGITTLFAFGFRQVLDAGTLSVVDAVTKHMTDHGPALTAALQRANDRAWQSLALALAGDGLLDQIKAFFAGGDQKGVAEQIRLFLADNAGAFPGATEGFRRQCLADLKRARKAGLLSATHVTPEGLAREADSFHGYADRDGLIGDAHAAVAGVADGLVAQCPDLARLLRTPTPGGPPLLAVAFSFFLRREVEGDAQLARGLVYDNLRQLHADQAKGFESVEAVLQRHGDDLRRILDRLEDIAGTVGATHDAVLGLHKDVQVLLEKANLHRGEVQPQHSFSIRNEDERRAVKQLLARFRELPAHEQQQFPELLNSLGKLQVGSGDFAGAEATFEDVARTANDASLRAEAHYNAYRAAVEEKQWGRALQQISLAAGLDPARFAPFDTSTYPPDGILGAGGFGTAFRCLDVVRGKHVVVKSIHPDVMDRSAEEVFREAAVLQELDHPAIIKVFGWQYADPIHRARPHIIMEYFPGVTLEAYVLEHGPLHPAALKQVALQIAEGVATAHRKGILHRDLKPANLLLRRDGDGFQVKVIDFGLALRRSVLETSRRLVTVGGRTCITGSGVGTLEYSAPEQLNPSLGVKVGPHSDVYAFGKVLCYGLFRTTNPVSRHWKATPQHGQWQKLIERCTDEDVEHRLATFEKILAVLRNPTRRTAPGKERSGESGRPQPSPAEPVPAAPSADSIWVEEEAAVDPVPVAPLLWVEPAAPRPPEPGPVDRTAPADIVHTVPFSQWEETHVISPPEPPPVLPLAAGEEALARFLDGAMLRSGGVLREGDRVAAEAICRRYKLPLSLIAAIIRQITPPEPVPCFDPVAEESSRPPQHHRNNQRSRRRRSGRKAIIRRIRSVIYGLIILVLLSPCLIAPIGYVLTSFRNADSPALTSREAKAYQKKWADQYGVPVELTRTVGGAEFQFVFIPPGRFRMGSPATEKDRENDETQHWVTLTKGFYLGKTEVTQAQWRAVMPKDPTPSNFKGDTLPVENVSWLQCEEFCQALSARDGKYYGVPTEAEWEYACRAGTLTAYHAGDTETDLGRVGWYFGNSGSKTHPVGQKAANAWGLHDMHGNVWEWCADWYGGYPGGENRDYKGPQSGQFRVLRGGSWNNDFPRYCRSAFRSWSMPGDRYDYYGVRLALRLD